MRMQTGWDVKRHCPKCKWEVTFSNGAFTRYYCSKWLVVAVVKARLGYTK
jgi:hypothetical protein